MIGLQYSVCLLDALFASQPPCHILPRLALTTHLLLLPFLDKFLMWQLKSFSLVFSFTFLRYPIRLGTTFLSPAWIPTTSPMFQSTSNIFKHIRKIWRTRNPSRAVQQNPQSLKIRSSCSSWFEKWWLRELPPIRWISDLRFYHLPTPHAILRSASWTRLWSRTCVLKLTIGDDIFSLERSLRQIRWPP